ncbi:hypothetical protein [Pseudomonas batumici]|uniref:Uncharacterized protein n=1 Tax=Pseudomonas batumici TaxID=226910 RepID=A0A0C2IE28_9PSED|nr:hypothetical protein [Pseudomonas batumici]KIH83202.1 hypothetical protein UCMB321_3152 [Pseudomonas batumici]
MNEQPMLSNALFKHLPAAQRRALRRGVVFVGTTFGTFLLLSLYAKAHAAGGSYVVDDGGINDPGQCNVDTWYKSGRHHAARGESVLSADCTPTGLPAVQLGADINRSRDDGEHTTLLSPHIKASIFSREDLGLEAAVLSQAHIATNRRHAFDGADIAVPLTYKPFEALRMTLSTGWYHAYNDGKPSEGLTWGTGVEYDVLKSLTLVAERFGQQSGDQGWQAGPRLHIGEKLDIDLVLGQHLNGDRDRWFTTGATVRF